MDSIKAYFSTVLTDERDPDTTIIAIEKSFWDKNKINDDGYSRYYENIADAMIGCGAEEVDSSMFILPKSVPIKNLVNDMRREGIELIGDAAFDAWAKKHLA